MDMSKVGASLILVAAICLSLYFGVGGMERIHLVRLVKEASENPPSKKTISYQGETFLNVESVAVEKTQQKVERLFPWTGLLTSFAALTLTAAAFGTLGGATRVLKELVVDSQPLELRGAVLNPLFGFLIGFMLLGVSYVLPAALTAQEDVQLNPATLLFLCFFGGLFSMRVFAWIESLIARLFPPPPAGNLNDEEGGGE